MEPTSLWSVKEFIAIFNPLQGLRGCTRMHTKLGLPSAENQKNKGL